MNAIPRAAPALAPAFRGLKVWIAGAARSGMAAARLLRAAGAHVHVSDSGLLSETQKEQLALAGASFEDGGHQFDRFVADAQLLVVSPAIPLSSGLPFAARVAGIPVVSEIEVAGWFLPDTATCVAITGTNGKSTATHYTSQLFARGGRTSVACGNFGLPLASAVGDARGFEVFALELSSYQIECTFTLRPRVTVFLNLQKDHLARYENLETYLKAKWRLVCATADDGLAIVDAGVLAQAVRAGLALPRARMLVLNAPPDAGNQRTRSASESVLQAHLSSGPALPLALYKDLRDRPFWEHIDTTKLGYAWFETGTDGSLTFHCALEGSEGPRLSHTFAQPCLPGEHNRHNLAAASIAGLSCGLSPHIVFAQWEEATTTYEHLPHRLEPIGGKLLHCTDSAGRPKRLTVVNDSKATNVESAAVALKSYSGNVRLLLGGEPKGESFEPLSVFIPTPVCKVYPFGAAASQIAQDLGPSSRSFLAEPCRSLMTAAQAAFDDARDGDIVLLSPACASFDEFKNFEHRGDSFKEWVLSRRH